MNAGFDLMGMLLGHGPDAELKAKMGMVLVQIVDAVCEQQLDARLGKHQQHADVVTPVEMAKIKHDMNRMSQTVIDLLTENSELETRMAAMSRMMTCDTSVANMQRLETAKQIKTMGENLDHLTERVTALSNSMIQHASVLNGLLAMLKANAVYKEADGQAAAADGEAAKPDKDGIPWHPVYGYEPLYGGVPLNHPRGGPFDEHSVERGF